MAERFAITTPIYYVNALPHLGTFYSTVVADALARCHRARHGKQGTYFLTGLDEHGQKIERIAKEKGIAPKSYCDQIAAEFAKTWQRMEISHDRLIRTTDADHEAAVAEMWKRMAAAGDIYPAEYDGLYCVGCEDWKAEDEIALAAGEKICPVHGKPVERVKEKNYFFRLSKYQDRLLALYDERPAFIRPETRRNEVVEFVKRGLRDISVSRATVKWGIPVPGDPSHVVYVWIDALTNYVTALGGPTAVEKDAEKRALWANTHHLIAKDILRFHAVYWPAMLMSAGLSQPAGVFCHGYLTVKGQKISKSIPATRVDPNVIADALGADPLRYFVLREYALGGDGDFAYEALFQRHEADLGNDLGNLVNRVVSIARTLPDGPLIPAKPPHAANDPLYDRELTLRAAALTALGDAERAWDDLAPARALEATWTMIRAANTYVDHTAPWALKKAGEWAELRLVLANTFEAIRRAALMIAPAMPATAREILRQIGRDADLGKWPAHDWTGWPGGVAAEPKPIFPRLEPEAKSALIAKWLGEPASAPTTPAISIDDFAKVELRAAKVLAAERVPKADKLLKLTLDLGHEQRTVVSGVAAAYAPEAVVGKTVVLLANLAPAKIRGVMSQGMILAAGDADVLGLVTLDRDVPAGTKIR